MRCLAAFLAVVPFAVAQTSLTPIAAAFAPFDLDGDGVAEIESLAVLRDADAKRPRVVLLVEARLLEGVGANEHAPLRQRLLRLADDLDAEGFQAGIVAARVHAGPPHQDGRTLLALRRFLRALAAEGPLAGAVLIGHFPDALLVRTCNWRRTGRLELQDRDGKPVPVGDDEPYLRAVPEIVAHKCDLVLADLEGDWESCYLGAETSLPGVVARFANGSPDGGEDGRGGSCLAMHRDELRVADAFFVHDGRAAVDPAAFAVAVDDDQRDAECTAADRAHGNAIARPRIAVSRIDARGVAWSPRPEWLADGQPRERTEAPGGFGDIWMPDPGLEQRLLVEYLDRNHAFRTAPVPSAARRPASISWGLGSGMQELRAADAAWATFAEPGYDVATDVDLVALVEWLRRPAVLRTLRAHSNGYGAAFAHTDATALLRAIGGQAWNWERHGQGARPSLQPNAGGSADFFFYRTLWQDHATAAQPYLLVHTGCEAISPPHAQSLPYDDPRYGERQHAEAILFFTPCLAIVGRAKVFYDDPRGFCAALAAGKTFGDAWRQYFELEGSAANWDEVGGDIGRKRAYFWSLLGDFTLRLPRGG